MLRMTLIAFLTLSGSSLLACPCDPLALLKDQILPEGEEDPLFKVLQDESEAAQANDGRTLYWVLKVSENRKSVTYKTGQNDLWAQLVKINKKTCALTVLAEH
jgi:hypothetical protein